MALVYNLADTLIILRKGACSYSGNMKGNDLRTCTAAVVSLVTEFLHWRMCYLELLLTFAKITRDLATPSGLPGEHGEAFKREAE